MFWFIVIILILLALILPDPTKDQEINMDDIDLGKITYLDLMDLSPTQFERVVADLYKDRGYKVQLTPKSSDRGVDIIVRKGKKKGAVQCKRWKRDNPVGVKIVRNTLGLLPQGYDHVTVVTTSRFTRQARSETLSVNECELVNGNELIHMLKDRHFRKNPKKDEIYQEEIFDPDPKFWERARKRGKLLK